MKSVFELRPPTCKVFVTWLVWKLVEYVNMDPNEKSASCFVKKTIILSETFACVQRRHYACAHELINNRGFQGGECREPSFLP